MNKPQNLVLKEVLEIKVKNLTKFLGSRVGSKIILIKPDFSQYAVNLCASNTLVLCQNSVKKFINK